MGNKNVGFRLVPEHVHWRNVEKREIRTQKNNFLSGISSVDNKFLIHFLDQILDQAHETLNILCPTRINPTLSANNIILGTFYFNRTPMEPPGCMITVHEKPVKRRSWTFHGIPSFILDPLRMDITHTRFKSQRQEQSDHNTLSNFSTIRKMPFMSATYAITKAVACMG